MKAKSYEYWETKWNEFPGTDVEKTLAILATYVSESKSGVFTFISNAISGILGLLPYLGLSPTVGLSPNFARAREVGKSLEDINPSIPTVEFVVASLKQKINDYRGYKLTDPLSHWRWRGADFVAEPDHFYVKNVRVRGNTIYFDYTVIALSGKVVTDKLELQFTKLGCTEQDDYSYLSSEDLIPYFSDILELTSAVGITRGRGINRDVDNLAVILEVIKEKVAVAVDYFLLNEDVILDSYKRLGYPTTFNAATHWQKQVFIENGPRNNYLTCFLRYVNVTHFKSRIKEIALSEDDRSGHSIKITLSSEEAYNHLITELADDNLPLPVEKIIHRFWIKPIIDNPDTQFPPNTFIYHSHTLYDSNEEGKLQRTLYLGMSATETLRIVLPAECDYEISIDKFTRDTRSHPPALGNRTERQYSLYMADFSYANQQLLSKFLNTIIGIDPSTSLLVDDLCEVLAFHRTEVDAFDIAYATTQAIKSQARGNYEVIWALAQDYYFNSFLSDKPKKVVTLSDLRRIFGAITKDNPHYAAAQTELSHFTFSDEDKLKDAFCYALAGNDPVYTANLYGDLCGLGLFQSPVKSVKLDAETLLTIAQHIKEQGIFKPKTKEQSTQTDEVSFSCERVTEAMIWSRDVGF